MIPKAEILSVAEEAGLLPTTVEKDYALGWVLFGIASHPELRRWYFKGGTCLKKCFFDTYRFSEDLDFTVLEGAPYGVDEIRMGLLAVADWVQDRAGLEFPADDMDVQESINKRGHRTFAARMTFQGPLQLPRASRQRIRFDLTRDEVVAAGPEDREIFHGYTDAIEPRPKVRCYSLSEVLAEKVRALYERSGRARDVYDVVNIGRNLRGELSPAEIAALAKAKFQFKELDDPSPDLILARVDPEILAVDWSNALRHQLPILPPVADFLSALGDVLRWLLTNERAPELAAVPGRAGEVPVPPIRFAIPEPARAAFRVRPPQQWPEAVFGSTMDRVRYGARNRLMVRVTYRGISRLVEPYSLRMPGTGNLLLYVFEVDRGGSPGGGVKAFKVAELGAVSLTDLPFQPRYIVEL